jgi:hypothetical protein
MDGSRPGVGLMDMSCKMAQPRGSLVFICILLTG